MESVTIELPGYRIIQLLYTGSRTLIYQAVRDVDQLPVILKLLREDYPTVGELIRFRNQYRITQHLAIPGVVKSVALERYRQGYALVTEDVGGISLADYLIQSSAKGDRPVPLSVSDFLVISLQIAEILVGLHQSRVIHKDLKPANVLIQPDTKQVNLIDFSISSLLPKETQEVQNPTVLEGTLAYLSPEQTGRMNRGIDYRSDFYSLGVTFYELLTGQLPFATDDPMELMHCHLAKTPVPVAQINPTVPIALSKIVSKLMAKNAEDRYQTASGLAQDLKYCQLAWQTLGEIPPFTLGQQDVCDRFTIPEKLYGRELEVAALLAAFERVAGTGWKTDTPDSLGANDSETFSDSSVPGAAAELMLVAGFSGIGKTAVAHELHKPIVQQHGYFITGKFDQFNRNSPFSAFVQALRDFMGQLLSESDAQLQTWKTQILTALGENGQVIIDVLPELEQIIGAQPAAAELSGIAAQNRFNLLFQRFIQVFTTPAHPLVMFLDDLQWADLASLRLMQRLMTESETGYLLLIGAYRDHEVTPAHPLMLTQDAIAKAGGTVNTIHLQPLSQETLNHLVADTLHCTLDLAQPLTHLIHQKTQGNPFFATQFLKALHQEGVIYFVPFQSPLVEGDSPGGWQCDIVRAQGAALTEDVVVFMTVQLQKLPDVTQEFLKLAACIGNQFDLATLAIVAERSPAEVAAGLWDALQAGLILPQNEVYKFFGTERDRECEYGLSNGLATDAAENWFARSTSPSSIGYKFLHDRVQQAAYALIAEDHKQTTHRQIGQLLLDNLSLRDREDRLFEIVNHLNVGSPLITQIPEQINLAEMNLAAGRKAKLSTAYSASIAYFTTGIALLPTEAWERHYPLMLALHQDIAEASYLNLDFEQMEHWVNRVLYHAKTLLDTIKVQQIQITGTTAQGKLLEALQIGLQVLQSLGIEFPAHPTQADIGQALEVTRSLWADKEPRSLLELPPLHDPHLAAAMEILTVLVPAAYMSAPTLLPLLIFKQVELSIQSGNCPVSVFAYGDYGLILCGIIGDIESGYEFGELALSLLDQLHVTPFKCRSWYVVHTYIKHWKTRLSTILPCLQEAYQSGLETGDNESLSLNATAYCQYAYYAGQDLAELAKTMNAYRQTIHQYKQTASLYYQEIYQQTVLNLLGRSETPYRLTGEIFDQHTVLPELQAVNQRPALFLWHINQTILYYLFGHNEAATKTSIQTAQYLDGGVSTFAIPLYSFFDALIQLTRYVDAGAEDCSLILSAVQHHQDQLHHWAALAPENHQHRWELVEAERHRVLDRKLEAIEFYDRAIARAQKHGFIQDEALANELAAQFYSHWGKEKVAAGYLQEAYYCYARWGAIAKTADLEQRYPHLLLPIFRQSAQRAAQPPNSLETLASLPSIHATRHPSSSSQGFNTSLDFAAVLEVSQAISGTIKLDELLQILTQALLENSGADKCALVLCQDEQWHVSVIADLTQTTLQTAPLEGNPTVPVKLIQYVKNTLAAVVVDHLATDLPVIDEYFNHHRPQSMICLPILNQGHLTGILYLENQVTSGVFTSDRLLVLNILSTQAAISLDNARLYNQEQQKAQEVAEKEEEYRSIFESANDGLSICDLETGKSIAGNPAVCQMHGYTQAEWLSLTPSDFLHPDSLYLFSNYLETLRAGQDFYAQAIAKRKDGSFFDIEVKAVSFIYRGKCCGLTILRDISEQQAALRERRHAVEELETFRRKLTFLIQSTPMGVIEWNPDFKIVSWNPAAEKIFGYTTEEILGCHALQIVPESSQGYVVELMQSLLTYQGGNHSINENLTKDGRVIICEWINTPLSDEEGCLIGIYSMMQDVTDRKATEAAIAQKSQELEQALQELQDVQLQVIQSEKMSALGNLVAGVAHEINNPVGCIVGNVSAAQDYINDLLEVIDLYSHQFPQPGAAIEQALDKIELDYLREDLPKLIRAMKDGGDRITSISKSLRTFSRADSDTKQLFDIHDGIDSTVLILRHRLKANNQRPEIEVSTDYGKIPQLDCFPGQLNQVFMNILANAIDALDESNHGRTFADIQAQPNRITIRTAVVGDRVSVTIGDNGTGIPEHVRASIFDHLFTTKGVGKGTGLGLAIAHQIVVEKHGGTISVESSLGRGTEFSIMLPLYDTESMNPV